MEFFSEQLENVISNKINHQKVESDKNYRIFMQLYDPKAAKK